MPGKIITLTTDFGLSDHYVGVMKGVILRFNPEAQIVDLCHQVDPFDVLGGCLMLAASYEYFPEGTVHVVVVDPGVGSARHPLVVEAGSWLFVAPDNGVLELVYRRHAHQVRVLRAGDFALQLVSQTFHGRDVFAPAAGLLSRGEPPENLGDAIKDYVRLHIPRPQKVARRRWTASVLKVDRFGNLITNLTLAELPASFLMTIGDAQIQTLRPAYSAAAPGEIFAITGSSGYLEISINEGSAAEATGAVPGATIEVLDRAMRE